MPYLFNKPILLIVFALLTFIANGKLSADDSTRTNQQWLTIISLLNQRSFAGATRDKALKLSQSIHTMIPRKLLNRIKTNQSKLRLLLLLEEAKQQQSIELLIQDIKPERLKNQDSIKYLLKVIHLSYFNITKKSNIILLRKLQRNISSHISKDKKSLITLIRYLKKNLLIDDAINLAQKIWQADELLFQRGELNMIAYKFKQQLKKESYQIKAINDFNALMHQYPNSKFRAKASIDALSLQIEITPPLAIQMLLQQTIYPNLKSIPMPYKNDLLNILSEKITSDETIATLKEWYLHEEVNYSSNQYSNEILLFLVQKAGFDISKLTQLIKKQKYIEITEPPYFKNMLMEHKIKFLTHWDSPWQPYSGFHQKSTGIIINKLNQLLLKCKNTQRNYTKLILSDQKTIEGADYFFFKVKNPSMGNTLNISVRLNHEVTEIAHVRPNGQWQLIRIPIKNISVPLKKITIYLKSPQNGDNNYFFIMPPTSLKIKTIVGLKAKEKSE